MINPLKIINSFEDKSVGRVFNNWIEDPNSTFIQLRKKKVGPSKYNNTIKKRHKRGNRSKKKLKKRISEINIIDPGNPKKN